MNPTPTAADVHALTGLLSSVVAAAVGAGADAAIAATQTRRPRQTADVPDLQPAIDAARRAIEADFTRALTHALDLEHTNGTLSPPELIDTARLYAQQRNLWRDETREWRRAVGDLLQVGDDDLDRIDIPAALADLQHDVAHGRNLALWLGLRDRAAGMDPAERERLDTASARATHEHPQTWTEGHPSAAWAAVFAEHWHGLQPESRHTLAGIDTAAYEQAPQDSVYSDPAVRNAIAGHISSTGADGAPD